MAKINVVDLFAGPGGLGEGFARWSPSGAVEDRPFHIAISAEKDSSSVATLQLRTFFRLCEASCGVPASYYDYLRGDRPEPYDASTQALWAQASSEALQIELGTTDGDNCLAKAIERKIAPGEDWVLIGGPPCQAYSLAGRSRNKGIRDYLPEKDERHFLYNHYLSLLAHHRPAAFLMENVKGILSSQIAGNLIFPQIMRDLQRPDMALGLPDGIRYHLRPFVVPPTGQDALDPRNFIICAENFGVPQARHRVIILGVREDKAVETDKVVLSSSTHVIPINSFIATMPRVRSGLSRGSGGTADWMKAIKSEIQERVSIGLSNDAARQMRRYLKTTDKELLRHGKGGRFVEGNTQPKNRTLAEKRLHSWLTSPRLGGVVNHEAKSHMASDLVRYLFASWHAEKTGRTPKACEFPHALAPDHRNWKSGDFADRFRVQSYDSPATTIVSHIAKDGHYYIHPDPQQCRSLTVREAARLQTFPDDFFFEGPRTAQYVQVGNAVPPYLAYQMAATLQRILS